MFYYKSLPFIVDNSLTNIDIHRRALNILEPIFENHILAENGQNILGEQKHWTTLLNMIPDKGRFFAPSTF